MLSAPSNGSWISGHSLGDGGASSLWAAANVLDNAAASALIKEVGDKAAP